MMISDPDVAARLAGSLTARTTELLPFLPYLLQDLFTLGTSPGVVAGLVRKHMPAPASARFLDLGCGKGAVGIRLALEFQARVTGIDIVPEFVAEAQKRAETAGVGTFCNFIQDDVTAAVARERGYDCVVLGAIGNILGDPDKMLQRVLPVIAGRGFVFIDDAYVESPDTTVKYGNYPYLTRDCWEALFVRHGLVLLETVTAGEDDVNNADVELEHIRRRAGELAAVHPERREMFEDYVRSQADEYDDLANAVTGAAWMVRKGDG